MYKKRILFMAILLQAFLQGFAQQEAIGENTHGFSLRTNLLYWAVATPNLGIEWQPSDNWGILVNGAFSHWIWSGEGKHHRTWLVQPEVRYYFPKHSISNRYITKKSPMQTRHDTSRKNHSNTAL